MEQGTISIPADIDICVRLFSIHPRFCNCRSSTCLRSSKSTSSARVFFRGSNTLQWSRCMPARSARNCHAISKRPWRYINPRNRRCADSVLHSCRPTRSFIGRPSVAVELGVGQQQAQGAHCARVTLKTIGTSACALRTLRLLKFFRTICRIPVSSFVDIVKAGQTPG